MESLIKLLLALIQKVPFLSELEQEGAMDLLRDVEHETGVSGVVPVKAGTMNAPTEPVVPPEVPGPVAEPPAPEDMPLPPTSPEVSGTSPEEVNAFADPTQPPDAAGAST